MSIPLQGSEMNDFVKPEQARILPRKQYFCTDCGVEIKSRFNLRCATCENDFVQLFQDDYLGTEKEATTYQEDFLLG